MSVRREAGGAGGRRKVEPDPEVRAAILAAASRIVDAEGVGALGVAKVLDRAQLSTRAFYRHFGSKDELVSALFLEMARAERLRLRQRMDTAADPVRAVAAWIDARLDLALNARTRSDLRKMSLEAQAQMSATPELIGPAYAEILLPLVEELRRGRDGGLFPDIDPETEGLSIQAVVWAAVERHWSTGGSVPGELRSHVQRFCLRGLGVAPETIAAVIAGGTGR
ncbi:TetR/AcrR family transcriptional regulator [Mycobacterium sp. Y57]|uniref:TetR/AcrR family transcriptional regulator n=1 Tax=Mycolicibacterium xanthum TaxID=2796469 RepID=UPI001C86179F|nr:TetR/AcrR family transcriptional regulator [Mycolicibacterium xanthum]MBX7434584.1 TetR/AcrR family transcriptional regulator [Mycolicibacterium xanthum]